IMFTFFEMITLAPVGLCIIAFTWHKITLSLLKRGVLLGSSLCLALFTIAIALKYSTATGTAFFPALNGFLAALFAWMFLRQPLSPLFTSWSPSWPRASPHCICMKHSHSWDTSVAA